MTVQDLIDALEKVKDKSLDVVYDYDARFQDVEEIRVAHGDTYEDDTERNLIDIV